MFNNILKYLTYGNCYCGIEHYSNNGKDILQICLIKQSKNELDITSTFTVATIEEVSKKLPKNQHVTLVINNDKVLSKTIESEQNDAFKIVYKAFPNINLEDFYFEILSEKNTHFVSLCRIDYIESIIKNYSKQRVSIIDLSLGNTIASSIKSFINNQSILTSNSVLTIKDQQIVRIKKQETEHNSYNINGLTVSNDQLLSFSATLKSVLRNGITKTNFEEKKYTLTKDFKNVHFFNQFLKLGGFFILILLIANFFFFSYFFNKVNELQQVSEINQSIKTKILKLDETVTKKQKMVDDLLKSNGSKSSFYCNSIIHSLPNSILLSEFNYQPLSKRIKTGKLIDLDENTISVSGSSNDSEIFSNWLSKLEKEDWIERIDIIDYGKAASNQSDFKLKLILTDD
ncbi:hypothetical protein HSX10_07375 [Winogradskyella undariae]|uniref:hypothetical protein n=1 Tax=Winogradskyella undariae TaxID=1285465 RepID=UPI00156B6D2F|nr:hypothetical protein [Winogradskyella undariae]NRR91381.1 hypothetical protein [Winogradskyella undariae]